MHPVLFRLGRFELHAYGLMLALSFLIGIYFAMRRAEKKGVDRNAIMDLSLIVVICAIAGSRFLYVVTHLDEFRGNWLDIINPFQGSGVIGIAGLSMLGGVIFSVAALFIFCHVKKISILKIGDIMAPSFAIGIFLTRIGCFLSGCCFGKACNLPWALVFPSNSPAGHVNHGIAIHPTQIYSSLYGLAIFGLLLYTERKRKFEGSVMSMFFILYGIARFLVDYVRYYEDEVVYTIFGSLFTINQIVSFFMFLAGVIVYFLLGKRHSNAIEKS